ncbi:Cupredoxin [Jimgerdemannia flammicorona]|uniref:Cupredoxin n=1 Tax=Jimgerdemannia flammicorona TaxID=994334 RepID=A0A433DDP7_9FUNG|nr:Cupredoxin [Jimgerdemannia flammicorona]
MFRLKQLSTFLVASLLLSFGQTANVTLNWDITYVQANPDGLFERRVIGINGAWPPPPVTVNFNDTLVINAKNSLDVVTALHSHGLFQNGTGYYDGPVGITQCGIPPGETLTYVSTNTSVMSPPPTLLTLTSHHLSLLYHCISSMQGQYVDGLRTSLVIHAAKEVYTYDEDLTIILSGKLA